MLLSGCVMPRPLFCAGNAEKQRGHESSIMPSPCLVEWLRRIYIMLPRLSAPIAGPGVLFLFAVIFQ